MTLEKIWQYESHLDYYKTKCNMRASKLQQDIIQKKFLKLARDRLDYITGPICTWTPEQVTPGNTNMGKDDTRNNKLKIRYNNSQHNINSNLKNQSNN